MPKQLGLGYINKLCRFQSTGVVCAYALADENTAILHDAQLADRNGSYSGVVVADATGPGGYKAPRFDGSSSYANFYAGMGSFSTATGTAHIWFRPRINAVLSDGATRRIVTIAAHASDSLLLIEKTSTANTYRCAYVGGGTTDAVNVVIQPTARHNTAFEWHCLTFTWDTGAANEVRAYLDGAYQGNSTTLGTWSGSLLDTACVLGSSSTTPADVWDGWLSNFVCWNVALTAAEVKQVAKLGKGFLAG